MTSTSDCYSREIQQAPNGRWHIPSTDTSPWLCLSTTAPSLGTSGQSSAMRPRTTGPFQATGQQRGMGTGTRPAEEEEEEEDSDVVCTNPFER